MKNEIQEIMNDINNQNYVRELMHHKHDIQDFKIFEAKLRAELEVDALRRETEAYMEGAQDMQNHIYGLLKSICKKENESG